MSQVQTVLIADDDHDILTIVSETVRALGLQTVHATDGIQAIAQGTTGGIDLAILDVSMPGHTGLEVCRAIKASSEGVLIPVILLTARDTLEDKISGLDSGADEYLTKPFHAQELQARVRAALRVRALNMQLHEQSQELQRLQESLVAQERKTAAGEVGGAAAHALGQPLSSILLNLYLLEELPKDDPRFQQSFAMVKADAQRMKTLLEQIRGVDGTREDYFKGTAIAALPDPPKE